MNTVFKSGAFVDFTGRKHLFTVAGTILNVRKNGYTLCYETEEDVFTLGEDGVYTSPVNEVITDINKIISIGISICNPGDEYDEEIGKEQAKGRALKRLDRVVAFSKGGMCTEDILNNLINLTVMNIISNPGMFIPGYNKAEEKYLKSLTKQGEC